MRTTTSIAPLIALSLVACQGSTDSDAPTPDDQTVYSGTIEGDVANARTASGSVEVNQATTVELWSMDDLGGMAVIASTDVRADGSFAVSAPAYDGIRGFTIVQALDAQGEVVVANVVEETGRRFDEVRQVRLDPEATVESLVWLNRTGLERNAYTANLADIRMWIDGGVALEAYERMTVTGEGEDILSTFTHATQAALAARMHSLQQAGWTGDAASYYLSSVNASQQLSETVRTQGHSIEASGTARATVDTALANQGLTPTEIADAHSSAALAYQLVIHSEAAMGDSLADQALRASMRTEAWAASQVLAHTAGTMSSGEALASAAAQLWTDVYGASTRDQAVDAFDDLSVTLESELVALATVQTPITSDIVGAWVDGSVDTLPTGDIDDEISELLADFSVGVDSEYDADMVAEFWSELRTDIAAAVFTSALFATEDTDIATEMVLHASVHAR